MFTFRGRPALVTPCNNSPRCPFAQSKPSLRSSSRRVIPRTCRGGLNPFTKGSPMRRYLPVLAVLLAWAGTVQAHGLLIPDEKTVPPLAMLNHKVTIAVEDQVAVTHVEQTFRNHTDRELEATYVFPVPKGASVND